jgi:hypothetical protein
VNLCRAHGIGLRASATNLGLRACRPVGRWRCWCPRSLAVAPASGGCFPGRTRGWCGGRGGRSRWPRRPVPGGAAVVGVPISSSMTRPAECRRAEATSRRCAAGAREVACPMADCRPGQVLGQLLCLGEGEGVAGASPWLSGRGRPGACMSACWRCAASWRASAASARLRSGSRSRSRSRAGSGRSGPWGRSDKDGNGNRNRGGCRRASRLGWQRCNRERAEPDRALPVRT